MDEPPALTWHGNYALLPLEASSGSILNGDKIILPQSALEQLLSASASQAVMQDKSTTASSHLPNPLTFRLVNPTTNKSVYAGIREFSAPEGTVILSPYLLSALDLAMDGKATTTSSSSTISQFKLGVHTATLPKGTYARLRPLEAGYNPDDWRPLLERQLQRDFTSLTENTKILVHGVRGEVFQLLVDKLSPDGQGVCVVDTDLEVDIEALDEEQARETLRQFINTNRHENEHGGSKGGPIDIWKPIPDKIAVGSYIDYSLPSWDRNQSVQLTLSNMSDPGALELFVTPRSNLQRSLPRNTEHVFSTLGSFESSTTKTIIISPTNAEMKNAESIQISVHAYPDFTATKAPDAIQYTLRAQVLVESDKTMDIDQAGNLKEQDNGALCSNCQRLVPKQKVPQEGDPFNPSPEVKLSGLTAHELADGARTTECDLCDKIIKLKDMQTHLKHHELDKVGKEKPPVCRNENCGRTRLGVGSRGQVRHSPGLDGQQGADIGLCSLCFGPLYVSMHDPDGKALRRRIERRYLTQLMSGCRKSRCSNEWCKTGRSTLGLEAKGSSAQAALPLVKPLVETWQNLDRPMHFCVDDMSQTGRKLAGQIASEGVWDIEWCIAAAEAENSNANNMRDWLQAWAPRRV
ncbi:hypothetical protein MY11210_008367 [Beauveria gryllotalpidicola]